MPHPFHLDGAEQCVVTPSGRVGEGTGRGLEMLESVLAPGGLVLLRGEGSQTQGLRNWPQGKEVESKSQGSQVRGGGCDGFMKVENSVFSRCLSVFRSPQTRCSGRGAAS